VSRKFSLPSRLSILLEYVFEIFPNGPLHFIGICFDTPFSSQILLIWVFSYFILVSLSLYFFFF
jgi:hypothetical protein